MFELSSSVRRPAFVCVLILSLVSCLPAQSNAAQDARAVAADGHQPLLSEKTNAAAHRLLENGLKTNALTGDDLKPWHMKIDFQVIEPGVPKPVSGSIEEWYVGPHQWRRVYHGGTPNLNGAEWSVSKFEHYQTKPGAGGFSYYALNLRTARPVVDPMYQAANIHPDYDLVVQRVNTAGVALNCVSVPDPKRYAEETNPDWPFATMCFDSETRLRLTVAGDTSVQFDDLQSFQGRTVARDVKVIQRGNLIAAMKVTFLEALENATPELVQPAKNAVSQPYIIEPGFPAPEPVYQVGAHVPLRPDGTFYQGTAPVPVLIHKDGTVKVQVDQMGPGSIFMLSGWRELKDALMNAVGQWKYKPYIVDGQPIEVGVTVMYPLDGKPFVPAYERLKPASVHTAPEDYASAYDPKRDPQKDLAMAQAAATRAHKRILIEVGGDWCVWCKYLDKFLADHADVREQLTANYVVMKVNMSPQNENSAFLSQFPKISAYPYFVVLDADGKILTAKKSGDLEECCKTYNSGKMKEFLTSWKSQ